MTVMPEQQVADIVQAAGGRLVSRIRLQKIAYLLDQLGAHSGFDYTYHHFGPYSRDLDSAVLDAEAFDLVKEKFERRQSDGARYSIFEALADADSHRFSYLDDRNLRDLVKRFASTNITVLELAATAHWLSEAEKVEDWETEIRLRKGSKTEGGRLEKAKRLLVEIGLSPAA
ncbi:hypothetical protein N825_20695 [Skermanella stibiiresistens SB22]|uniref:Antitoxin SocA-like Panacea domain-containing protein n=1 Tax=Skermanella stibiiresistens SB22 TaxID=1385369 RepID=W9GXY3_9PROT|nr:hypothetical protein [Skermanella stibiiresistens]EWY37307.1 hypothetical protein N825_20695 [Skermanella stibiiresistens SB22]